MSRPQAKVKRCKAESQIGDKACGRTLPNTVEFFGTMGRNPKTGVVHLSPYCRVCNRLVNKQRHENRREMMRLSPEKAERERRKARERERKRRERPEVRARRLELERGYRAAVRRDQARLKVKRERDRIARRLRREKRGEATVHEIRSNPGVVLNALRGPSSLSAPFERLPSWPVAAALRAEDARRRAEHLGGFLIDLREERGTHCASAASSAGIVERNVYAWEVGERIEVTFDNVDQILTRLDWCWWEVFTPQTVRRHALVVAHRRPVADTPAASARIVDREGVECVFALDRDGIYGSPLPSRAAKYVTVRRDRLGDLGPDLDLLGEVGHMFECVGFPQCETCRERRRGEQVQMVLGEAA